MMPAIREAVAASMSTVMSSTLVTGILSLALLALGIMYVFEMVHMEMRAEKQRRRERRQKSTIPWSKIKISGPGKVAGWLSKHIDGCGNDQEAEYSGGGTVAASKSS